MRSIWKGAISFGLVRIPVRLYSATEDRDVSFHQVRRWDGSRIRYQRVAAADGAEVPYSEIAKGYELPSGETVVLTDDDFANLPLPTSHTIDVLEFVPLAQVDPIYFAKSYYVEPDRTGVRSYVLLRDALARSGRVALVKIALRQREQLATLRIRGGVLVLSTMVWPDEVRRPDFPFLGDKVDVGPQELVMAQTLIETLSDDFDPSPYTDGYRQALQALIDAKASGEKVMAPPVESETATPTDDLVAVLAASVAEAHRNRQPAGAGRDAGSDPDAAGPDGAGPNSAGPNGNGNGRQGARTAKGSGGPRARTASRR
ncbi:Ku protein [Protofrankia symbiont of Coriaria ruscifolia]|uniref:non-homologous end joining protein Ku n=1 Tax=Protofrankia symbiont of Coriaria ruscifolia TaxID=1306542 RepID=UPI001041A5EE|nr:Ku protein [Protofrankia symbiont of Coriaria ruscifolia]